MDEPIRAFELLSTRDETKADELALHLTTLNDARKTTVSHMMKEIRGIIRERDLREVVVVGNPKWRIGVVGLAAGTLAEELNRPVFVWGREGGEVIKGSCRSEGGTNMVDLMVEAGDVFLDKGGHEQSGGFSVTHEHIHHLEDHLVKAHQRLYPNGNPKVAETPEHDYELSLDEVDQTFLRRLERFAPFGIENPKPLFLFRGVSPKEVRRFGKEKQHMEFLFPTSRDQLVSAISFFSANTPIGAIGVGERVHVFAHIERNGTRFGPPIRLRIVSLKEA
jgi:single-stranded-DNA-specific exonuclease